MDQVHFWRFLVNGSLKTAFCPSYLLLDLVLRGSKASAVLECGKAEDKMTRRTFSNLTRYSCNKMPNDAF
jgi:hypothetical protein